MAWGGLGRMGVIGREGVRTGAAGLVRRDEPRWHLVRKGSAVLACLGTTLPGLPRLVTEWCGGPAEVRPGPGWPGEDGSGKAVPA